MSQLNRLGLKKLKINFEYNSQKITVIAEPYKTIKEMKLKALKHIFPIPPYPRLFYLNKEITYYENEQVGTYFEGKSALVIKITSSEEYKEEFAAMQMANKHLPSNDLNEGNVSLSTLQSKRPETNAMNGSEYLCSCSNEYVMYYCRNCKEFLCQNCRMNKKHKTHLTIHVDTQNLEESIRLYAMIIQTDIETSIQSSQDFYSKFRSNAHLETASKQEEIFNKLEELTHRYNEIMYIIENSTNSSNEIPLVISEFNLNSKIINGEVDNILNEVYSLYSKTKKKMTYDQFKSYFHLINSKEKDWDGMTKDVLKYKINSEINGKVKRMYEKINSAIDELLNDCNPFMLEERSLNALGDLKTVANEENNFKESKINRISTNNSNNNSSNNYNFNSTKNKMIQPQQQQQQQYDNNDDDIINAMNNNYNVKNANNANSANNDQDSDEEDRRKRESKILHDKARAQMKKKKDSEEKAIKEIKGIHAQQDSNNKNEEEKEKKSTDELQTQIETVKKKEPIIFDEYKLPPKKRRK